MKKNLSLMFKAMLFVMAFTFTACSDDDDDPVVEEKTTVVDFEDLTISSGDVWKGPDTTGEKSEYESWGSTVTEWSGKFTSNGVAFSNVYNETWYSYTGFIYTTSTSTAFTDYTTDYNSVPGGGYDGSKTYAVGYSGGTITITSDAAGKEVKGCYITNNTYAYNSMTNGDSYAKKFEAGDYFKVIFTADNGKKAEFYLADMSNGGIVTTWEWFDLTSLGAVKTITFSFESSDTGDYGINTPTYFCMDDLTIVEE